MPRNPVPPVGLPTYHAANYVLRKALIDGTDPVEALNKAGLLVTPARARGMEIAGLKALLDSLYGWSTVEMLRKKNRTIASASPADMYEAVLAYVGEFVKYVEEKGLD